MKTHTIKWNGDKTSRIITFTPKFMEKLKTAKQDMAIRATLHYLTRTLKAMTGRSHTFNYFQELEIALYLKSISNMNDNYSLHRAQTWMIDGMLNSPSLDIEELFDLLNHIFSVMHSADWSKND